MAQKKPDARVQYAKMREGYGKHWDVDMWKAPCKDPLCCLASVFCPPCTAYWIRRRVLYNDLRGYLCCGGYCPCSGRMCESSCPWLCLAVEVTLCYPQSVFVTRFMIQDGIANTHTHTDSLSLSLSLSLVLVLIPVCVSCHIKHPHTLIVNASSHEAENPTRTRRREQLRVGMYISDNARSLVVVVFITVLFLDGVCV